MEWKKWVIVFCVALSISLAFLIYFIVLTIHFSSIDTRVSMDIYSKANVYDTQFHDLTQEHTFLLINTARRSLDSSVSFNDSYKALQININEVAAQISAVYGPEVANQFKTLWESKITYFINYTEAVKNNDNTANSVFAANMVKYENDSAVFWSNLIPSLDKATMTSLITQHLIDIKSAIDYWGKGDYQDYFIKLHDSYTQMGVYADVIAQAIINQHPEVFQ